MKKIDKNIIPKFIELQELYPPLLESGKDYSTVKGWLKQIRTEGYTPDMMQEILHYILTLIEKEKWEEASLLLLVSSATQESDAYYFLGRELYKGILFKENKLASFGIFSALAEEGHAEALCDLALFYKNGIHIKQNKKEAKRLYLEAMNAGVQRAKKHYEGL